MDGFGERLRKLRRDANITQSALAEYIGVIPSAVGKYELYSSSYPSIEALLKISEFFHVSTDYLLKGTEPMSAFDNSINKGVNNGAIVQANSSSVVINNKELSPEAKELVNIYEKLSGRDRLKLLNYAVDIEEGSVRNETDS